MMAEGVRDFFIEKDGKLNLVNEFDRLVKYSTLPGNEVVMKLESYVHMGEGFYI